MSTNQRQTLVALLCPSATLTEEESVKLYFYFTVYLQYYSEAQLDCCKGGICRLEKEIVSEELFMPEQNSFS